MIDINQDPTILNAQNGMVYDPNVDTLVYLRAKPTYVWCEHCKALVITKLRQRKGDILY